MGLSSVLPLNVSALGARVLPLYGAEVRKSDRQPTHDGRDVAFAAANQALKRTRGSSGGVTSGAVLTLFVTAK